MRGFCLEENLENLEIGVPVDVDKKRRAYNIVPVWWGELCGRTTVFILIIERKREPSPVGEKRGNMACSWKLSSWGKRSMPSYKSWHWCDFNRQVSASSEPFSLYLATWWRASDLEVTGILAAVGLVGALQASIL